jgi:SNF2 family DNA or RNA helicase
MSSKKIPPESTQSTPAAAMPGASKEESFQELIRDALAPVLPELLAPQSTDLEIHANERVIKDRTNDPTIRNMEIGVTVPVPEGMTPEDQKTHVKTLTRDLDNFLEDQVLYEPDNITSVPHKRDAESQTEDSAAVGRQSIFATKQCNLADQHLTVGEACRRLGIRRDPISRLPILGPGENSGTQPFTLRPWQVTGVQWMFTQESEPIRGGIVADACGMGKTLMALTLIFLDAKRRSENPNAIFRPNLIVFPSMIFHVWFDEIKSRFGNAIELHLFYGWKEILLSLESDPHFLLGADEAKLDKLANAVAALDPKRRHTAFTVFLTTYNTWRMCQYETKRERLLLSQEV